MSTIISENQISYSLIAHHGDVYSFRHNNGQEVSVRIMPRKRPDGKFAVYEKWPRLKPGRSHRLLTERGFEIVFELPLLFEFHLEQVGYPEEAQDLVVCFFEQMAGEVFRHYPKELFK